MEGGGGGGGGGGDGGPSSPPPQHTSSRAADNPIQRHKTRVNKPDPMVIVEASSTRDGQGTHFF